MQYAQEQLEEMLKASWSYENRAGWGAEEVITEFIGTIQKKDHLYDIYMDASGNYWYKVRIRKKSGVVPEYEAIFGYPERRR